MDVKNGNDKMGEIRGEIESESGGTIKNENKIILQKWE